MHSDLHSKGGKYVVGFVVAGRISRLKNAHCLESLIVCLSKKKQKEDMLVEPMLLLSE